MGMKRRPEIDLFRGCLGTLAALALALAACAPEDDAGDMEPADECSLGTNTDCTACGDSCDASSACVASGDGFACVTSACSAPEAECDGRCIDVESNSDNCGRCGNRCEDGSGCVAGECVPGAECAEGTADCNADPADGCETAIGTRTDCSGCGEACDDGQQCVANDSESGTVLACDGCDADPDADGFANSTTALCGVEGIGFGLKFSRLEYDFSDNLECKSGAGAVTFHGIDAVGIVPNTTSPICRVSASGNTLTFLRLEHSFSSEEPTCTKPGGQIVLAGAELSGHAAGPTLCGVNAGGGKLTFLRLNTWIDEPTCTRIAGTITMARTCAAP